MIKFDIMHIELNTGKGQFWKERKRMTGFKRAKKEKIKEYFVPGILNDIIGDLKRYIEETGAIVTEIRDISYGKKIGVQVGLKFAEINLFYGKRGFNVVKSPKQGTSEELNAVVAELVTAFIEG